MRCSIGNGLWGTGCILRYLMMVTFLNAKELKFIHITKTGGSAVENAGKAAGIKWGRFHSDFYDLGWHQWFPLLDAKIKEKYDWFMVVRNPYTRAISEFHCQWGGVGKQVSRHNKHSFNQIVRKAIRDRAWSTNKSTTQLHVTATNNTNAHIQPARWHWSVQSLYIDDMIPIRVLRFENLDREFGDLMREYNLTVDLGWANMATEQETSKKKKQSTRAHLHEETISSRRTSEEAGSEEEKLFTTAHFDDDTIKLIQSTYMIDFMRWGYSMTPPPP